MGLVKKESLGEKDDDYREKQTEKGLADGLQAGLSGLAWTSQNTHR